MKQLTGLDTSFLNLETSTSFGHINSLSIYQRPKAKKDFD
ncbi:MAG: diacylglycerol O-acyltransferase, partial [Acidimicrobiales bacterium]